MYGDVVWMFPESIVVLKRLPVSPPLTGSCVQLTPGEARRGACHALCKVAPGEVGSVIPAKLVTAVSTGKPPRCPRWANARRIRAGTPGGQAPGGAASGTWALSPPQPRQRQRTAIDGRWRLCYAVSQGKHPHVHISRTFAPPTDRNVHIPCQSCCGKAGKIMHVYYALF